MQGALMTIIFKNHAEELTHCQQGTTTTTTTNSVEKRYEWCHELGFKQCQDIHRLFKLNSE